MSARAPGANPLYIAVSDEGQQTAGRLKIKPLSGIADGIGEGAILAVYLYANGGNSGVLPLHFTLDTDLTPIPENGNPMLDVMPRNMVLQVDGPGGNGWIRQVATNPQTDEQPAGFLGYLPIHLSRLQAYDPLGDGGNGAYNRVRIRPVDDDADLGGADATAVALDTMARAVLWAGTAWTRARAAAASVLSAFSSTGAALVSSPGEWAIQHTPAAATQATISRAAGGAGVRHVCRSITCSVAAVNAQGQIIVNLRDGATGAGTILWSAQFILAAGTSDRITLTGLNIVGSANTAMTLEVAAAPAAGNFASVALTGFDTV